MKHSLLLFVGCVALHLLAVEGFGDREKQVFIKACKKGVQQRKHAQRELVN